MAPTNNHQIAPRAFDIICHVLSSWPPTHLLTAVLCLCILPNKVNVLIEFNLRFSPKEEPLAVQYGTFWRKVYQKQNNFEMSYNLHFSLLIIS